MSDSHYNKFIKNIEGNYENIDTVKSQKMTFIFNALNNGWAIKKKNDCYIFKKSHDGDEEVFTDSYLTTFICDNLKTQHDISN